MYLHKVKDELERIANRLESPDETVLLRAFLSKVESKEIKTLDLDAKLLKQKEQDILRLVSMVWTISTTVPEMAKAFKFTVLESSWEQNETVLSRTNLDKASKARNDVKCFKAQRVS